MYSGETSLVIDDIYIVPSSISAENDGKWQDISVDGERQDSNGDYYGTIKVILRNGFEFGSDLRDKLSIKLTAHSPSSDSIILERYCNFTLLGVKGGKEGIVYRIEPSDDIIMYDPNANLVKFGGVNEAIPVSELTDSHKITVKAKAGMYTKTPTEIENDNEYISYSIGQTYSTAEMAIDTTKRINNEVEISKILGIGEENVDPASRFVTFYWIKKIGTTYYMIDRETVPVISAGINGKFAKVELGNEVDAISIGDDFVLDAEAEVGTTVKVVDGALNELEIVKITASPIDDGDGASGTDENWPEAKYEISLNGGSQWTSPVQSRGYKLWRFTYALPNGFDFGENRKEKIKLDVRFINEAGEEQELSALFTIVGIPDGKEGQKYQLIPSVDVIRYFTSDEMFDTDRLTCDAALGLERLENAKIYYGTRIRTEEGYRVLDIKASDFENEYALYPVGGVNVRDVYFGRTGRDNWAASSQIAFYLTIDVDGQEMIVDHETVPIISDGKDADPGYKVELSNEIESIATGTDTGLGGLGNNKVTAQTEVYILRGMEKVEIHGFDYEWIETGSDRMTGVESVKLLVRRTEDTSVFSGEISARNPSRYATLQVVLNKDFDFGAEMRKRLILKLTYIRDVFAENDADKYATVRGLFTLIGVKAGKDGNVYRIVPTPDYVLYDYTSGAWSSPNTITCKALNGSSEMTAGSYEVYYSQNVLYEVGNNAQEVKSKCQKLTGPVGPFTLPSLSDPEPKFFAFYLIVDGIVVDRETVPLVISGKNGQDGKDGVGTVRFDLQNLFEVINTGTDDILDAQKTYYTYVTAKYGNDFKAVNAQIKSGSGDGCTVSVGNYDSANNRLPISVTLKNGFNFTTEGKRQIKITASLAEDATVTDELTYTLIRVKNGSDGDSAEGTSYRLLTNAASVVYDGSECSPSEIKAKLFVGSAPATNVSQYGLKYVEGKLNNVDEITNYGTYEQHLNSDGVFDLSSVQPSENGTIYIAAFGLSQEFLDSEDLPVTVVIPGGGSSGIIADLSNERMVVRIGNDDKLSKSVENLLNTVITIKNGFDPLPISTIGLPGDNGVVSLGNNASIKFRYKNEDIGKESVQIDIDIMIQEGGYIDLSNPLSYTLTAGTNFTKDEIPMTAEFPLTIQIIGLKGGNDGETVRLQLSHDSINYDATAPAGYRFTPNEITASLYVNFEDVTNENVWFELVNSNSEDSLWLSPKSESEKNVFTFDENKISEFNPITVTAWSGATDDKNSSIQMDSETVNIYRNGRDGEGGFVVDINPKSINVETNENKTLKRDEEFTIKVGLMSGSVMTECDITAETIGNEWFKNEGKTEILINSTPDDELYYTVTVRLSIGTEFNESGRAGIVFKCHSTAGNQTRVGVFYIYASTSEKGDRGPQTRLRDWSVEHADGNESGYQAGGENDGYIDIVWHRNKYYLCKKTHDPKAKVASYLNDNEPGLTAAEILERYDIPDGITEGNEPWREFWEEYEAQPFTASKIATFGEWPKGWVIDKGKIQHTLSAITLDADGEINVQSPAELLYEYNGSNGTTIYATRDYEDPNIRALYSGNAVPVYVDSGYKALNNTAYILGNDGTISLIGRQAISIRTYRVSENHILPGYSLSDILEEDLTIVLTVAERELSFKNRYKYNSETEETVFTSGSGTCRQVVYTYTDVIKAGDIDSTDFYSIPKHQTVVTDVIYNHTYISATEVTIEELKNYQWPDEPTFVSSSSPKQILLGSSAIATTTQTVGNDSDLVREGEFVPSFSYDNDIITCPSDSNYYSDSVSSDKALFIEETGSTSTRVVKDLSMVEKSSVTSATIGDSYFVYFDKTSFESAYNNKGINIETLGNIVGDYNDDGSDLVVYNRTAKPAFSKQDEKDRISTKINATNEGVSVEDGRIMLAAGINNNANYIYKWKHDDSKVIYEIYGYKENFKSFEHGQTVLIYTTNETNGTQIPVSATIYKTGTITGISYNGTIYYYAEAIQLTEPVQFAATRIFENGKIVTNGLHAHNGVFNGRIEATSGTFSGEINAEGGNIRNVSIENADINGNLNIRNGKSLTIYNTNSEPSVTLSSAKIDGARNTKNVPFGSVSFYDTRKGWGTKTVLIEKVVVPKGYKLKIPKFRVRTTSFTRVGDRSVFSMYYQTGTTRTYIQGANNTSISKSSNFTTPSTVFTANQDAILSLYATFSYELKGDAWIFSDSKIGLSVTPEENGEITYANTTVTISKSEIGTNGFVFANKNGSRISMVTGDDGNTNIDILVNGGLGFSIDSNKFAIIYGNYSYNLKDILNKLTELGVTPEQV